MKNRIMSVLLAFILVFLSLCGCASYERDTDKLSIVCSIFVPYDFAKHIAGDRAEVTMLLPPGVESHSYEPTPADIVKIENADLFIYVSEHTETWVTQISDSIRGDNVKTVDIADALGIELHGHDHDHNDEHDDDHDEHETDEHIWTNLETAADMVYAVSAELEAADGENADYYRTNARSYAEEILSLRDEFNALISNSSRKEIVSGSRFAMKNFTNEFGIEFTAAFDSCVDNTEPSAGVMAKIIDKINAENIPVIFYEELTEPKIARAVMLETGAKMLLLHSCHNISMSEFKSDESYVSLMKRNYINLREALN